MSNLEEIVSAVAGSKKYHAICPDTIRRIAARELAAHGSAKPAVKATKRRLHQVYGAFEGEFDYEAAYRQLEVAYGEGSEAAIKAACRRILEMHSSTRERLPLLEGFYPAIFERTGQPATILDLGCGLNPLALPWMGLAAGTGYVALDIDANRVRFLNRYLALTGFEPLARCQDILSQPPEDVADVALLLKMSPSLERQEPGVTLRLLERLRTPYVVLSFAVKSLGGREKGMAKQYQQQFTTWMDDQRWPVEQLAFETELVFVVKRGRAEPPGSSPLGDEAERSGDRAHQLF
jgi:16S rRNA (guanine(1405)-N(7))-methyltransferase